MVNIFQPNVWSGFTSSGEFSCVVATYLTIMIPTSLQCQQRNHWRHFPFHYQDQRRLVKGKEEATGWLTVSWNLVDFGWIQSASGTAFIKLWLPKPRPRLESDPSSSFGERGKERKQDVDPMCWINIFFHLSPSINKGWQRERARPEKVWWKFGSVFISFNSSGWKGPLLK